MRMSECPRLLVRKPSQKQVEAGVYRQNYLDNATVASLPYDQIAVGWLLLKPENQR